MVARRSYGSYNDGCAAAHALDLIGDRWTMIVVRELLLGPKRFADLQRDVLGIGPGILTRRLHELTTHGVAVRRRLPGPGRVEVYELTAWGLRLETINSTLSAWAVQSPTMPFEADMSPDTLVLAMRTHARPLPAGPGPLTASLTLTDSRQETVDPVHYRAIMTSDATTIERVPEPARADATITASTRDWKACVIGGTPLSQLPGITITGDRGTAELLITATAL
ncbi:winged helix-turn-helix transcriptional regulator [Actinoplanes couchii]|uniref:Transcriptional regulator n=1 Tax=Actinoplanes couchii TaxID=403638 RepID=A0ABQ3XEH8_9ACTN|nr:helix-turn-helix domain-containing protein [Actinoplanes couchii]MDR6319766.1 DNA-binding HxlR family transcriptional regulator [Actinoplanes couchii]GID56900.1 transcriptional regulator [Actinoplanes couchii]